MITIKPFIYLSLKNFAFFTGHFSLLLHLGHNIGQAIIQYRIKHNNKRAITTGYSWIKYKNKII